MTIQNDPSAAIVRRSRYVPSRELGPGSSDLILPPDDGAAPPSPALLEPPAAQGDVPVLDPTKYSRRRRKRSHVLQYRLAELCTGLGVVAILTAVACLVLGDRWLAEVAGASAVGLGLVATAFSWRTRLSSRVLGYAIAATLIAIVVTGAALALPDSWFNETAPDEPPVRENRPFKAR